MKAAQLLYAVAELSLCQVLLPKLCYPLNATMFTEQQCQNPLKLVFQQGLPAMCVNQNFPCAVACGQLEFQGLNLPNLFTEQFILQVQTLVIYRSYASNVMGNLIGAHVELLQLETEMGGTLFQIPSLFLPCMMSTWISQCWVNCIQRGINITMGIPDVQPK